MHKFKVGDEVLADVSSWTFDNKIGENFARGVIKEISNDDLAIEIHVDDLKLFNYLPGCSSTKNNGFVIKSGKGGWWKASKVKKTTSLGGGVVKTEEVSIISKAYKLEINGTFNEEGLDSIIKQLQELLNG